MAEDGENADLLVVKCNIHLPDASVFTLSISPNETVETLVVTFLEYNETYCYTSFGFTLLTDDEDGELLNDYLEIGNYMPETPDNAPVIDLRVALLDYNVKKIRDHVRRTRDFITTSSVNMRQSIHDVVVDSIEEGAEEGKEGAVPESNTIEKKKSKDEKEKREREAEKFVNRKDLTDDMLSSLKTPVALTRFFDELLMRHASEESKSSISTNSNNIDDANVEKSAPKMFEAVKSIMESGWSPPSAARRMQGDMLYLEVVTATEGVFHVTCTGKGFFVNRSSRNFFDPRPSASNPGFSHSLYDTLYSVLPTFRKSVLQNKESESVEGGDAATEPVKNSKALDSLLSMYTTAEPSDISLTPGNLQWNTPPTSMITSGSTDNKYDMSRTQESMLGPLAKMSIMEEKGPPREWNEDLQVARSINTETRESRLFQAKLLAKTIADFEMVCKHTVVDIVEGNISPYNPVDSEQSQVFLYQGVFFSGAVDQKETFRISEGDVASRKYAAHDLENQKRILSCDIDGLCHVLQMIIDYKGRRFIAQNIIPGILNPSGSVAGATRLLYGTLDQGNRMKCKTDALKIMEEVASKFYLPKRNIPAHLTPKEDGADVVRNPAEDAMATQAAALGVEVAPNAVREDDEDEVVPVDSENIPHYGPIEFKLIEGSDKRVYALEACRLTPRDANYVPASGTSLIKDDVLTKHVDGNIAKAYLLRHELVESYMNHKYEKKRTEIIARYTKDLALDDAEEDKDTVPESVAVTKPTGDTDAAEGEETAAESEAEIAKKEAKAKAEKEKLEKRTKAMLEANKEIQALSKEKVNEGFVMNPNVFFDERIVADTDSAVVNKDEEIVREISKFLYDNVLPSISRSVRKGETNPLDNIALVSILHTQGVNMRYLGRLAHIAREEEMDDHATTIGPAVPIYSMPKYWRNMLETEILARCVKIYVNQLFAESGGMKDSPAATIASILNILLVSKNSADTTTNDTQDDNASKTDQSQVSSANTDSKGKKKKNKKSKQKNTKIQNGETNGSVSMPPTAFNAISDKAQVITAIDEMMKSRFLYSFADILSTCESDYEQYHPQDDAKKEKKEGIDGEAAKHTEVELTEEQQKQKEARKRILLKENKTDVDGICGNPLGKRLPRLLVLRRVCQVMGLRVVTKDYDFTSAAFSEDLSKGILSTNDIMGLVPLFKSCGPDIPLKDIEELIVESQTLMQTADVRGAFNKAQEAHQLIMQVAGPSHRVAVDTQELLANILMNVGDLKPAIELHQKAVSTLVTLEGLDSNRVVLGHFTLAQLHISIKDFPQAIQHFRSALYCIALMGGRDHPVIANIYQKIAEILMVYPLSESGELREQADLNFCLRLFDAARTMSPGLPSRAMLGISVADIFKAASMYSDALNEVRNSHAILSEIFGEGDSRTQHLKKEILILRRKVTEIGVLRARKVQQDEERHMIEEQSKLLEKQKKDRALKAQKDALANRRKKR